jgi:hypothetical protein
LRENAPPGSVACFEDDHARGRFGERACCGKSGGSGSNDDDIGIHVV